jgi:hypothetical protein
MLGRTSMPAETDARGRKAQPRIAGTAIKKQPSDALAESLLQTVTFACGSSPIKCPYKSEPPRARPQLLHVAITAPPAHRCTRAHHRRLALPHRLLTYAVCWLFSDGAPGLITHHVCCSTTASRSSSIIGPSSARSPTFTATEISLQICAESDAHQQERQLHHSAHQSLPPSKASSARAPRPLALAGGTLPSHSGTAITAATRTEIALDAIAARDEIPCIGLHSAPDCGLRNSHPVQPR